MSKYPRYPASLDLRRRVTPRQVSRIKTLYHTGLYTQRELGEIYCISQTAIHFIVMDGEKLKLLHRQHYIRYRSSYFTFSKERRRDIRRRKRALQLDAIRRYYKIRDRAYKKRLKMKGCGVMNTRANKNEPMTIGNSSVQVKILPASQIQYRGH